MAKRDRHIIPEFQTRTPVQRAGFIPADYDQEYEVETWQVWLRSHDGEESKRATFGDMRRAGFKPGKRWK